MASFVPTTSTTSQNSTKASTNRLPTKSETPPPADANMTAISLCTRDKNSIPQSTAFNKPNLFSECALVEIIHLHDCLRGALHHMEADVERLAQSATLEDVDRVKKSSKDVSSFDIKMASDLERRIAGRFHLIWSVFQAHSAAEDEFIWPALKRKMNALPSSETTSCSGSVRSEKSYSESSGLAASAPDQFGQAEYEDDHAKEEHMFQKLNDTLRRLVGSFRFYDVNKSKSPVKQSQAHFIVHKVIALLKEQTNLLSQHLQQHLTKEENQCLPMIQKHLSKDEITDMVGNIMGKRSSDLMEKIFNLAVSSLPAEEREDMVKHMKKAMEGTFFEKWLSMGGWASPETNCSENAASRASCTEGRKAGTTSERSNLKRKHANTTDNDTSEIDSKSWSRKKNSSSNSTFVALSFTPHSRPPSRYYTRDEGGSHKLLWSSTEVKPEDEEQCTKIPQFPEAELAPTYRRDVKGRLVLGCEHYARSCKLRHPATGQLFTCRLCCGEEREKHGNADGCVPVLDRHAVSEVLCMKCESLQPAGPECINSTCVSAGKPFARYWCSICNLYDDGEDKHIYHCPYCNVCRKGKGLGIDFRHCMRCNACVALTEYNGHVCIPQRLQGNCPICNEAMFESTEPLRGMSCGHVMHLSCFKMYVAMESRRGCICPYCKQVVDNSGG